MATFVLIHGTGHGGWCWRFVRPFLRERGHEVVAPTLTGVGERSHLLRPDIDLSTHIRDVVNVLEYEDLADVVLVGHSYAGMVVAGVVGEVPERIGQVIYLDAYTPRTGESWLDLQPAGVADTIRAQAAGNPYRERHDPAELGVTDPEIAAWVAPRLTRHPLATYAEKLPVGKPEPHPIRRAYVHCTQGASVVRFARFAGEAERAGWPVRYLATGHDAMLTVPEDLARVLDELAKQ
jgi:pimeloyl-ACP methyl ester carboxylesterase